MFQLYKKYFITIFAVLGTFITIYAFITGNPSIGDAIGKGDLKILEPRDKATIVDCHISETGNVTLDSLVIEVPQEIVKPNDYLTIFVQVAGGENWWVSGNPVVASTFNNDKALFNTISIGKPQDANKTYRILAGLTNNRYETSQKFHDIPSDVRVSDTIYINKHCIPQKIEKTKI